MSGKPASHKLLIICWALAAVVVSLVLILIRVLPIGGPSIFSDEYAYAAWSSAFYHGSATPPPLAAALGNWLYLRVYEVVFVGVGSFLVKARVLNAIVSAFGAGALVMALHVAEQSKKPILFAALGVGVVVALLGDYSAYFMPDAPYLALVCMWLLAVTLYARAPGAWLAVVVGIVGGFATMTKAHGMLMLPAVLAVFLVAGLHQARGWRSTCLDCVCLIAAWFACTTMIGFFLGHGDVNPIGGLYSNLGMRAATHFGGYNMPTLLRLAEYHLITLVLIMGMPLLLCFWVALVALFRPLQRGYPPALQYPALVLSFALLGMLFVTVVFTVSMAGASPDQSLTRLYGRYYEHFALLAACFGIVGSSRVLSRWTWWVRLTVVALFLLLLVVARYVSFAVVGQYPIDFATAYGLYGLYAGREWAPVLAGSGAVIAMLWPKRAPLALACALLIWLGIDTVAMERLRWSMMEPAAGRVAAMVAQEASAPSRATVEIVGSGYTVPVLRAGFHLLNERVRFALGADADQCGVDGATPDWVVTVGSTRDPCRYIESIHIGGAAAAHRSGPSTAVVPPPSAVHYHAELALVSQPAITRDGRDIVVTVDVTNDGRGIFGSATTPHNVNLGAHSVDDAGRVVNNDLARGRLPQIDPGTTAKATILLPVAASLGHRVVLLPVEEGVAWFGAWGTKALVVGPFVPCEQQLVAKVCGASGRPLPVVNSDR